MSERKWTPAQAAAIEDEGGALLVSAAAGSGKTAVLVERAVRLITRKEEPVSADRLLIVTFTYAAADELRSRIATRVEEEIRNRPADRQLARQRVLLRRAFIGTIDAYCQQLVREHFAELDLPPDVAVGDAALLEGLAAEAMAETMEHMYTEQPAFADFAALYGRARSDREAEQHVRAVFEFTRTLPHPGRQLHRLAAMYAADTPLEQTPWGRELLGWAGRGLEAALRLTQSAKQMAAGDEALCVWCETLDEDAAGIQALLEAVRRADWDGAVRALRLHSFGRVKAIRGYEGGTKERVQELRKSVKKIVDDLGKYCFVCDSAGFAQDRAAARPLVEVLCEAAADFERRFYAKKLEEKVLDFSDFEHLALGLLQTEEGERTAIAERVSANYDVVMVDEYQDTNELQAALYESLAKADGSNLFYVGDVKQSIYRFRKANPGLFLAKKDAWAPHGIGGHPAVITLGHNFRSGSGVIGGANFVFEAIMSPALGDIDYNQEEKLIQGREGGDAAGFGLHIVEDATGGGDERAVAKRIRAMVAEGYEVRDGEATRPCNYGDFCILLRARGKMLDYAAALEAEGVPVVADMAGELLQTPEVLPLTAMLAAIDNPADDVSVTASLLGPLYSFTAGEVAALRACAPGGSVWGSLLASGSEKAAGFVEDIRYFRARAAGVPVGRLCGEIVETTGYLSAVSAMEGGAARRENLHRFIAWAADASARGRGGLAAFVRMLQSGHGPVEPPAKPVPGHVTILTIHKSKGLEFPVCILADAAHRFNKMDLNSRVQLHADLGLGLMLRIGDVLYPTLPQLAVRQRVEAETLSEEMRVLYVALTRAKDNMLVSFAHKEPAKLLATRAAEVAGGVADPFLLARQQSFADWVVSAALCHPDAEPLLQHTGGVIPARRAAQGRMRASVQPGQPYQQAEAEAFTLTAQPEPELVEELLAHFAAQSPRRPLQTVPRKLSVSALAKQEGERVRRRPSFMYKAGLTAAEKGTAQHSFMQFASLDAARQDFAAELARLVREGYLEETLAPHVDRQGLDRFFASPLYARMQQSEEVLREYDFITAIPASLVNPGLEGTLTEEQVLVQGIADLVLLNADGVEIIDYKTDHGADAGELRRRYTGQLQLYAAALEKRLGRPVRRLTVWAFALAAEVDIPLP